MDPYQLLGIAREATVDEIEDAYDVAFDRYEPLALEGDAEAAEMLAALNDARETLLDPASRARLDASLRSRKAAADARRAAPRAARPGTSPGPAPRAQSQARSRNTQLDNVRVRRRASYAIPAPGSRRAVTSYLPFIAVVAVLAFALAAGLTFLLTRSSCVPADLPTGPIVATVNGAPVYQRELDEREAIDRAGALSDPLFASFFDPSTITGTRALDALKFDSLDKLVNLEVIIQQARSEGFYPNDEQQRTLVDTTAAGDRQPGESYEQMLCRLGISDAKYRRTVIQNVVYTVMANQYMPKEGTPDERTDGWIRWICETRKKYDVKILMQFLIPDNPSCTSGLPTDLPLPGLDAQPQPTVPSDLPTAPPPAASTPTTGGVPSPIATPSAP